MVFMRARQPDSGVATAVSSANQHVKFKRMYMFAIRSLCDFCVPPCMLYKENSLDAMEKGILPLIESGVSLYQDDEDLMINCIGVLWGISEALKEQKDAGLIKLFQDANGVETMAKLAAATEKSQEQGIIFKITKFVENTQECGIDATANMASSIANFLTPGPIQKLSSVVSALCAIAAQKNGTSLILEAKVDTSTLNLASSWDKTDNESVFFIEQSLRLVEICIRAGSVPADALKNIIQIIDRFSGKKSISEKGSICLSALVKPEDLKKCLNNLKSFQFDSPEHDEALTILSSMSYISSFAEEISRQGGIPLIIEVLNQGSTELQSAQSQGNEAAMGKIVSIIVGALKILSKVSSLPSIMDSVIEIGGVASICTAFSAIPDNLAVAGASCHALLPLVCRETTAAQVAEYGVIGAILLLLYSNVDQEKDFAKIATDFIAACSQYNSLSEIMLSAQAVEIVSTCLQYYPDDSLYQAAALLALERMAPYVTSLTTISEFGGIDGISASLTNNMDKEDIVLSAIQLIDKLTAPSDCVECLRNGAIVDKVLEAMLVHDTNPIILASGKNILEIIANEEDVTRHVKNLPSVVSANPAECYRALAAIAGLCKVNRLLPLVANSSISDDILGYISKWVVASPFEGQERLIKAGFQTCSTLKVVSVKNNIGEAIVKLLDIACLSQMKTLAENSDINDNVVVENLKAVKQLVNSDKLGEEELSNVTNAILTTMRKYVENRVAQLICVEILSIIAQSCGSAGTKVVSESGGVKACISYIQRTLMRVECQITGFTLLSIIAKNDPSTAEIMKQSGANECMKAAMKAHASAIELKRVVATLTTILMPAEIMEKEMQAQIANIMKGMQTGDFQMILDALQSCNELAVSTEGAKLLIRISFVEAFHKLVPYLQSNSFEKKGDIVIAQCLAAVSTSALLLTTPRVGKVALCKNSGIVSLLTLIKGLLQCSFSQDIENGLVDSLGTVSQLMKFDINAADISFEKGAVGLICSTLDCIPDNERVLAASCAALAAMATTQKRVKALIAEPTFTKLLCKLVETINNTARQEVRVRALNALSDLLTNIDAQMVTKIAEAGSIDAAFAVLDKYNDDPNQVIAACKVANAVGTMVDLRSYYEADLRYQIEITVRALDAQKNDRECTAAVLELLNKLTDKNDKAILKDYAIFELLSAIMNIHSDCEQIITGCGEILAKCGADDIVKGLMIQIINSQQAHNENYIDELEPLCQKLAVFVAAQPENPDDALQYTELCLQALVAAMKERPDDARLCAAAALVSQRLVDRAFENPEDAYGAWAIASSGMMAQLCDTIETQNQKVNNKKFLGSAIRCLAGCAANPYSRSYLVERASAGKLMDVIHDLLNGKLDPENVERALEFLKYLADDEVGAGLVAGAKVGEIEKIMEIMKNNKTHAPVVVQGMALIGNLASNGNEIPRGLEDCSLIKECEALIDGQDLPELRQIALLGLVGKALAANVQLQDKELLSRQIQRIHGITQDRRISDEKIQEIDVALAQTVRAYCENGFVADAVKADPFNELLAAIQENGSSPSVVRETALALKVLSEADENMAARVVHDCLPVFATACLSVISSDPYAADALADLLVTITGMPGYGLASADIEGIPEAIQAMDALAEYYGDDFGVQLAEKLDKIRSQMASDSPNELSLKVVYNFMTQRKENGLSLSCNDVPVIMEKLEFYAPRMIEIGSTPIKDIKSDIGTEFNYGCLAAPIISEVRDNIDFLVKKGWCQSMIGGLSRHGSDVVQPLIVALSEVCKIPQGALDCARTQGAAEAVCNALITAKDISGISDSDRELILIPRLTLAERISVSRQLFNGTKLIVTLLALWDQCEKKVYSVQLLKSVFRTMRRTISDDSVPVLLKANVLKRLISFIQSKDKTEAVLLPDILYLLGSLAVVPEIKSEIGEASGIQHICDLILYYLKKSGEFSGAIITNAILSLANLCIQHEKNKQLFWKTKGLDVLKDVLTHCATQWDIINASGVLICNIGYKHDESKKELGQSGIIKHIISFLNSYDGSDLKPATRALGTILKAVANLCLHSSNIALFINDGIHNTFTHLLKVSDKLPNDSIETQLRTIINIVVEHDVSQLSTISIIIEPLFDLMKKPDREEPHLLRLCIEVFCMLSRNTKIVSQIFSLGVVGHVINLMKRFDYDIPLTSSVIHLLSYQTTSKNEMKYLVDNHVFQMILNIIDSNQEGTTDLKISSLRLLRRCCSDPEYALEFISVGGTQVICELIRNSIDQPSVLLEAVRVLLGLLDNASPDPKYSPPDAPKGYEVCQLDKAMCTSLVIAVTAALTDDVAARQSRLQKAGLSILSYFASEGIAIDAMANGGISELVGNGLSLFSADSEFLRISIDCLGYMCRQGDDILAGIITDELITLLTTNIGKIKTKDFPKEQANKIISALKNIDTVEVTAALPKSFNFAATNWNSDPYPNGVHDLPKDVKDILRNGGKLQIILDSKTRDEVKWRASQDLYRLEWCIGAKAVDYNQNIPIGRIRNVLKGLQSDNLKAAHKLEPRKTVSTSCFVICGPASEDQPQGLELSFKAKSKAERDDFIEKMVMWRDAVSYG